MNNKNDQDNSSNNTEGLNRSYSSRSAFALHSLSECEALLHELETEFASQKTVAQNNTTNKEELINIKNRVAIMIGQTEKLQDTKIDAVLVGELESGKEIARHNRKALNRRVQELSSQLRDFHRDIQKIIESS